MHWETPLPLVQTIQDVRKLAERFGLRVTSSYRPAIFDWATKCPQDLMRPFPPVVGRGRGTLLRLVRPPR